MEYLQKSIVLSAFFPSSINSLDKFLKVIKLVKKYNLSLIEFYYEGSRKDMIKETLEKDKLKTVYLGAIASKREGLNLSSLNEVLRERTVEKKTKPVTPKNLCRNLTGFSMTVIITIIKRIRKILIINLTEK